jgi:cytochrome c-type biogenesis protein CcmH/NrfF
LWATPALLLIIGGIVLVCSVRSRRKIDTQLLTEAEETELKSLLQRD